MIGLDVDLPGAAELVEVVDVVRAEVDLQRVEDVADRHAQRHALGAVDVEVEPGRVGPGAVEQVLASPASSLPRATIWSLTRCKSSRPRLPRSSMMSLKPPVVPRPSIGGAPKVDTIASRTSSRQRSRNVVGDRVGRQLGAVPLVELLRA